MERHQIIDEMTGFKFYGTRKRLRAAQRTSARSQKHLFPWHSF